MLGGWEALTLGGGELVNWLLVDLTVKQDTCLCVDVSEKGRKIFRHTRTCAFYRPQ